MKQKLVLIFVIFTFALSAGGNASAQWVQTSCPYASYVNCFAADGTNLFVGTQLSGVYLSTDSGISWKPQSNGLPTGYCPIQCLAVSGNNLFAGLGNVSPEGIFRSTNNGNSWTTTNTVLTNNPVYALAVSGTDLFASTGHVFISTDEGTSWLMIDNGLPSGQYVYSLAISGTALFAGTGNIDSGGVYRSTNNGASWMASSNGLDDNIGPVIALAVSDSFLFAGPGNSEVNTGDVFLSTNNGSNWGAVSNGLPSYIGLVSAIVVSGANLFSGILGSGVYMTTFNGASWASENLGLTDTNVFSLAAFGGYLFAGTDSGVWRRPLSDFNQSGVAESGTANSGIEIKVFPNPASDELQILGGQSDTIHLFDLMGRERMNANDDGTGATLDVSLLESGTYFLRLGNQSTKVEISR